jgi:glutathione-regulated potassium-efflux system ancillary protein KefG
MKKTLIILAHANLQESRLNKALLEAIQDVPNITINDLYSKYKTAEEIDVKKEQELLLSHDRIIFQFPLFWFSSPGLLKDWQDKVLEYGFAFGSNGYKLAGKEFKIAITIGSPEYAYQSGAYVNVSINEILKPFEATANFTAMVYTPAFAIHRSLKISDEELQNKAQEYKSILLSDDWTTSYLKYLASSSISRS